MSLRDWPVGGYASLFGVADQVGDVVFAGAFRASLKRRPRVPMLVAHDGRLVCGEWRTAFEDRRGLWVEGVISAKAPAAAMARRLITAGQDGLSIGFFTRQARKRGDGGRDLLELDLIEVSLVAQPMLAQARLAAAGPPARGAF
jgi:uncharacterized protein